MLLRYTLAGAAQVVVRQEHKSESTSGGEADDAHAVLGQDEEEEEVSMGYTWDVG